VTILHSTARVRPAHHRIPTVNVPSRAVKGQRDRDSLERRGSGLATLERTIAWAEGGLAPRWRCQDWP
jgi:hypothetical protein